MYLMLASADPTQHLMISKKLTRERHAIRSVFSEEDFFEALENEVAKPDCIVLGNFKEKRFAERVLQELRSKSYGAELEVLIHVSEDTITARALAQIKELGAEFIPCTDLHKLSEYLAHVQWKLQQ